MTQTCTALETYGHFLRHSLFRWTRRPERSKLFSESFQPEDFERYDNFDDRWKISTHPHHFHLGNKKVTESPMNGNPQHDILILKRILSEFVS
jgi:hypothetical protein